MNMKLKGLTAAVHTPMHADFSVNESRVPAQAEHLARAGASGHAISFACEDYAFSLMDIEAYIGHSLTRKDISDAVIVQPETTMPSAEHREGNSKPNARSARQRGKKYKRGDSTGSERPPAADRASPDTAQTPTMRDEPPETGRETAPRPATASALTSGQPTRPPTRRNDFETPAVG